MRLVKEYWTPILSSTWILLRKSDSLYWATYFRKSSKELVLLQKHMYHNLVSKLVKSFLGGLWHLMPDILSCKNTILYYFASYFMSLWLTTIFLFHHISLSSCIICIGVDTGGTFFFDISSNHAMERHLFKSMVCCIVSYMFFIFRLFPLFPCHKKWEIG